MPDPKIHNPQGRPIGLGKKRPTTKARAKAISDTSDRSSLYSTVSRTNSRRRRGAHATAGDFGKSSLWLKIRRFFQQGRQSNQQSWRDSRQPLMTPWQQRSIGFKAVYISAVVAIWGVISGLFILGYLAADLPDLERLPPAAALDPEISIRASNGTELLSIGPAPGDRLSYQEIPDVLIQAFVAVEDRSFFEHLGVDPKGVARAAIGNFRAGRVTAGASTITQQLAKNLYLSFDRTVTRKARELFLAFWLEQQFSKHEILTLYLNRVYFGGGAYGVDAASRLYFGHSARTLSLKEAALLAGIVKNPSRYAPHLSPERSWQRAQVVLGALVDVGLLTPQARTQLSAKPPKLDIDRGEQHLHYFADWVVAEARAEGISGDMTIYTTINPALQRAASEIVKDHLNTEGKQRAASQVALVSIEPDGAVRALVGGKDYGDSQYNRATQARRQPGSAFKLFTYLAAIERGLKADHIYKDEPITIDGWSPKNYSGKNYGDLTAQEAFARSINTVAVKINENMGREAMVDMAKRLGISGTIAPIASLPLGTEEVRMIDLAGAYASVASGGFSAKPYGIIEIRGPDGELLYRPDRARATPVLSRTVVDIIMPLLTEVVENGSGRNARLDRPAAGKSGTSQDYRDAVFAGFTADLVTVVWTGNDDNKPMKNVTGGGLPARIWRDFMLAGHAGKPVRPLLDDAGILDTSR